MMWLNSNIKHFFDDDMIKLIQKKSLDSEQTKSS